MIHIADMSIYNRKLKTSCAVYIYQQRDGLFRVGFTVDEEDKYDKYEEFDKAMDVYEKLQEVVLTFQDELVESDYL